MGIPSTMKGTDTKEGKELLESFIVWSIEKLKIRTQSREMRGGWEGKERLAGLMA